MMQPVNVYYKSGM